jgi:hypothetical protein
MHVLNLISIGRKRDRDKVRIDDPIFDLIEWDISNDNT